MDSKDLRNIAEAYTLTQADKTGNTPAWQNRDKKNPKTGEPIYTKADHLKKEELEATGVFSAEEIDGLIDENRRAARAAGGFVDDSPKQTDPSKDGFTGISDNIETIMKQNAAMKKAAAEKKKVKKEEVVHEADSLSATVDRWEAARQKRMKQRQAYERPSWIPRDQDHSDNWGSSKGEKKKTQKEGYTNVVEDIADILAQIDEGIGKAISRKVKKTKRIIKRMGDAWDDDPGRAHTIGTLGNPNSRNEDERARQRKNQKVNKEELESTGKFTAEEIDAILEAERSIADRLERKRKLYDKTTKKAMRDAMETGEASGHNRYRMSSINREYEALKAKRDKKEK